MRTRNFNSFMKTTLKSEERIANAALQARITLDFGNKRLHIANNLIESHVEYSLLRN